MSSPLSIGALIFEQMDQLDFTGPFEVLCRLPDSEFHIIGSSLLPIRDARGLILTPEYSLQSAPPLDVLVVPGGNGVNRLMEDEETLSFLRQRAAQLKILFSVCTGALLCGAAGLLKGRAATTHWASHHLLVEFGATPKRERVVVDGGLVSASGVTSGIDGALVVAALLRGEDAAKKIQLYLEYDPKPPFNSGSPETAPEAVRNEFLSDIRGLIEERERITRRVGAHLRG